MKSKMEAEIVWPETQGLKPEQRRTSFLGGPWPQAILLLLALLPYAGVLRNDFAYAYDDKAQIIDNPFVHSFGHLREALTTPVWSFKDANALTPYYRPVMTIGFLLTYRAFGPLPQGFHLISLLLHVAVVIVLFRFAERLFRDRAAAMGAAGLFALHPIHVESVAWISAVTDLELTFFYLLAFWAFLQSGETRGKGRLVGQTIMLVSFLLALLSKEPALTLPFLALIFEHGYRRDRAETTWRHKLGRYGGLWLVAAGYALARVFLLGSFAPSARMNHLSWRQTALSAVALLGQYIAKLIWPARLAAFYVFHPSHKIFEPPVLAGIATLVVCAVIFSVLWKHARPASFGVVWLLATLAPVLNARWMGPYVLAERYLYLPSVGFCLVAGWLGATMWREWRMPQDAGRWAVAAVAGIAAVFCVVRIVTRIPDWHDDVTLFSSALAAEPNESILHDALGDAYWLRGENERAEHEWQQALRINPGFVRPLNALGALYARQRRFDEALRYLDRAIALTPNDADAHMNRGAVYAETGQFDRAAEQFRIGLAIAPRNFANHNLLGKLYFDAGRLDEAEEQFRESFRCDPNLAALDYLGYIDERRGDNAGAEKSFRAALTLNGADSHAHYHLGLIYAATNRPRQAVEEMHAALAADPNNPDIISALKKLSR